MDATGNNVSAQRTEDSTDDVADGIIATPMVQVAPQGGMSAPTIRALTDDDPPIPVLHVVDREKETEAPHLHGGPPGPPCFPREFDDSLAQRSRGENERNSLDHPRDSTSTAHSTMGASVASAAEVGPSMEERVGEGSVSSRGITLPQGGGMSAPAIRALTDDDPPIPVWHVEDHEKDREGPKLQGGPPAPPCFPREFDDSLAQRGENKFKRNSLDHPRGSTSTVHSTLVASVASAAAVGPLVDERVEEGSVSSRGITPPTSRTDTAATTAAAGLDLPSVGHSTFIAEGYRVAESEETPVYEAEISEPKAVLPFYQRTGFVFVMVAMILFAIGVVVWVLLPNTNYDKNTTDDIPGLGGATPQSSSPSPPEDPVTGQTAVNSLAPSSAPVILFGFGDFLQIGDWRLARACETCPSSHLSISSQAQGMTSQIFRDDGTYLQGPRTDYNGFDLTGGQGLAFSSHPIVFGFWAVQIRDWRIRQVDLNHLSVTNENDNVSRIYHSDGNVYGNVKELGGYVNEDLGEPTCAYLTSSFLQLGDWRFGEIDGHLSVTHKSGQTAMIYRDDGTIHPGPHTDYNAWTLIDEEVLAGTKEGCEKSGDFLQIGDWRLAPTCETCSSSHLSISSQATGMTSQIFLNVGTDLPGGKGYNGFENLTGGQGLYSTQPIIFGDRAVQIRDWRIRQVRFDLLSVTNENGNVSRIYRSDGTMRGNVKEWGGYVIEDLGEPTCAYLTSSFLQLGDWRFGEMGGHLSVTHKSGLTAMIYREDGTVHIGPRTDRNAWTLVDDEVLAGTKEGCDVGAPAAAAPSVSPPPMSTNGMRHA